MATIISEKVLIVEGKSDKQKIQEMLEESVEIICTNGTISVSKLDEFVELYYDRDVYLLFDSDSSGEKLRKQFRLEFPQADHLYVDKMYREVATTPYSQLAQILLQANFEVKVKYL